MDWFSVGVQRFPDEAEDMNLISIRMITGNLVDHFTPVTAEAIKKFDGPCAVPRGD